MTKSEFAALCLKLLIDPYVALENEELVEALQNRDDRKAIEILTNEFWLNLPPVSYRHFPTLKG